MGDPVTAGAIATTTVAKVLDGFASRLTEQIGRFTKPVIDRAVVDFRVGFRSYLDASYNRVRFFKTILNQAQPLEVASYYVHNTLTCGTKQLSDNRLISQVSKFKYVVVTGLAGSGKSMFMKFLTMALFESPTGLMPLFIELRQLNSITQRYLIEFIRAQCTASGHNVTTDQFKMALSSGAFTLLLDGFDELNHEYRDDVASQILEISKKYPDISIVVSSRHDDRFGGWAPFHVYNVDKMSKTQSLQLISTLEYNAGVKKRFHKEVKDRLYESHTSFLSSPLLTTIMLLTYEEFAEIPVKMHAFYSQAFDTLFQKHDASKEQYQRKTQTGLGRHDFKATFAAFCAMSYLEQKFSFEADALLETAESAVKYVRQAKADVPKTATANHLVSDLKEAVCLLQQDGLETAFVHRSFQEYFAALFATSLHGEKLKKVLDKYALRFGDSVISMAMDMARESVEQEWVIPTTLRLESLLFGPDGATTTAGRLGLLFGGIRLFRAGDHIYPSYTQVEFTNLGPLETLSALYPEQLGRGHVANRLRDNLDKRLPAILDQANRSRANYAVFEELNASPKKRRMHAALDLVADNEWWLQILELDEGFEKLRRGFGSIRRDIASRARKRTVILDEFL